MVSIFLLVSISGTSNLHTYFFYTTTMCYTNNRHNRIWVLCWLMTPGLSEDVQIMNDHTLFCLQITRADIRQINCDIYADLLSFSSGVCVGMYRLTYHFVTPWVTDKTEHSPWLEYLCKNCTPNNTIQCTLTFQNLPQNQGQYKGQRSETPKRCTKW